MRERLFALIAFNCELAKIPASVSEPMLGEIRLQWWRDAVEAIYAGGRVEGHEAVQAIAAERDAFDREALIGLIDARGFALGEAGDAEALRRYIDETGGAFAEAATRALGGDDRAASVARRAGWAEGAGRLLLAMPDLAGRPGAEAVSERRAALGREGLAALAEARAGRAAIPRAARAPLLSVHAVVPTLRAAAEGAPPEAATAPSPFRARAEFLFRAATGRF